MEDAIDPIEEVREPDEKTILKSTGARKDSVFVVPAEIEEILPEAFDDAPKLARIEVEEGSTRFRSINGVLYDASGETLIRWPRQLRIPNPVVPEGVVALADRAFFSCDQVRSISLPKSLRTIGSAAFAKCASLLAFNVPEDNPVFRSFEGALYDKSLSTLLRYPSNKPGATLEFPEEIKEVRRGALVGATNLRAIKIPDALTEFSTLGLESLELETIEVASSHPTLRVVAGILYDKSLSTLLRHPPRRPETSRVVPRETERIAPGAFRNAKNLTDVHISPGTKVIDKRAFEGCSNLRSIVPPPTLERIEDDAFAECEALEAIAFPERLEALGAGAFRGCAALARVDLSGTKLASLGNRAFEKCGALVEILLPPTLERVGEEALAECAALEAISLPDAVSELGLRAFCDCSSLKSAALPESLETIEAGTFKGCASLETIRVPSALKRLGTKAFRDCASLIALELPEGLERIPEEVFKGCSKLESIAISASATRIDAEAFSGCAIESIVIPKGVAQIAYGAFSECERLSEVVFEPPEDPEADPIRIGDAVFSGCSAL